MSGNRRLFLVGGGILVVVLVVVLIVASGGGNSAPASTGNKVIEVKNAKPVGGVQKMEVKKGGRVTFTVKSDTADEIHVHGYNFMKDVEAGGSVSFDFPAKIDGIFVIELESRGEQIASPLLAAPAIGPSACRAVGLAPARGRRARPQPGPARPPACLRLSSLLNQGGNECLETGACSSWAAASWSSCSWWC